MKIKAGSSVPIFRDNEFNNKMITEAVPYLNTIKTSGILPLAKTGAGIYFEIFKPRAAKAAAVISHGYCESIEKYREMIYYFTQNGYQVYIAEHRGHGRSLRDSSHPNMVHINRFSDYTDDLNLFMNKIVLSDKGSLPLYLFGHSMGGAIGTLYLEKHPHLFEKAVLSSPMLCINFGILPDFPIFLISCLMAKLIKEPRFALGQHEYVPGEPYESGSASCRERFHYNLDMKDKTPFLQTSGSSYGWAYESLLSSYLMTRKRNCKKITVPVLVFEARKDRLVRNLSIRRFVKHVKGARLIPVYHCRHEIYNSSSFVLEKYYNVIFRFFSG